MPRLFKLERFDYEIGKFIALRTRIVPVIVNGKERSANNIRINTDPSDISFLCSVAVHIKLHSMCSPDTAVGVESHLDLICRNLTRPFTHSFPAASTCV